MHVSGGGGNSGVGLCLRILRVGLHYIYGSCIIVVRMILYAKQVCT